MKLISCVKQLIHCIMNNRPLPTMHFSVEWGGNRTGFTEVTGLNIEHEVIEYREGSSLESKLINIPGLEKTSRIILKRGIMAGDNDFYNWVKTISMSKVERRDITIKLLNENHEPVMTWRVRNAWPVKLEGPELKADASEVAIETLELAHEGISIDTD